MKNLFQDGKILKNIIDYRISELELPTSFFEQIYIGRCPNPSSECSSHAGSITDVNIWGKALTENNLIEWTNCRLVVLHWIIARPHLFQRRAFRRANVKMSSSYEIYLVKLRIFLHKSDFYPTVSFFSGEPGCFPSLTC